MTHWQFGLVVVAAVAVRIVVVLGYPPVLWFSDSYNYLYDAATHIPDQVRPNGYPFFLQLLLPLHSDDAIGLVQAAMGVAIGIAIYALLRHRGLPWWGAALPALFDAYELHLEHMVTADPPAGHSYARASRSDTSRLRLTCCSAASRTRRR